MKLVKNWKSCLKWFSVQAMVLAGAIQTTWMNLPDDMKMTVPEAWVSTTTVVLMVLGVVGRVIKQGGDQ